MSKVPSGNELISSTKGEKAFQQLQLCVAFEDKECNDGRYTECITELKDYRLRVHSPVIGYLKVDDSKVRVVKTFAEASVFVVDQWGRNPEALRFVHFDSHDEQQCLTPKEPGQLITVDAACDDEGFEFVAPFDYDDGDDYGGEDGGDNGSDNGGDDGEDECKAGHFHVSRCWFTSHIIFSNSFFLSFIFGRTRKVFGNACVPETTIREYHPFLLKSSNLETLVSKQLAGNYLVGGIPGNKNFQELELCIVSSDYGCNAKIKSNCIYRDIEYRFRVNSPVQGYLRIVNNQVEIVEDFKDASGLTLYREPGWGLRVAHWTRYGERMVFAARYKGGPILMEETVANAERQWFELLERS